MLPVVWRWSQPGSPPTQPVVNVTWEDAALYCNSLSAQEKLPPFYRTENGKVVGIDCFEGDIHAGQRSTYDHVIKLRDHFKKYWNQTNVRFVKGYFEDVARSWEKPIDILHIDGLHTYEAVKQDFTTWSKFLQPNGVILMHDTVSFPNDVGRFFEELPDYKFNFQHTHGLGVWTASAETFERIKPLLIEQ